MGRMKEWMIMEEELGNIIRDDGPEDVPRPWDEFAVADLSSGGAYSRKELISVAHVTHVSHAMRIIEDGKFRANIVEDKGRMTSSRTKVVWLSPNDWTRKDGFRYGNIRCHIPLSRIIEGRKCYWVEVIRYSTPACRILVTDNEYPDLEPYDPKKDLGPWIEVGGQHFWNGRICLEIMIDSDVPFEWVERVDFVEHSKAMCCLRDVPDCGFRGVGDTDAGAFFLATLFERGRHLTLPGFLQDRGGVHVPTWGVYQAIKRLEKGFQAREISEWGSVVSNHPSAGALVRAALSTSNENDCDRLMAMFAGVDEFLTAFKKVFADALGLQDESLLYDCRIWS